MCIRIEKKQHMWDKSEQSVHHFIYIYIYIKEYNVCNKSGHKTIVHVMRKKNTSKPHYIPQKHSPPI